VVKKNTEKKDVRKKRKRVGGRRRILASREVAKKGKASPKVKCEEKKKKGRRQENFKERTLRADSLATVCREGDWMSNISEKREKKRQP